MLSYELTIKKEYILNRSKENSYTFVFAVLTFFTLLFFMNRVVDPDMSWHIRAGQWMLANKQILTKDIFTFTSYGKEWYYPGFLAQVILAFFYQVFEFPGVILLAALIVTIAWLFLWQLQPIKSIYKLIIFTCFFIFIFSLRYAQAGHIYISIFFFLFILFRRSSKKKSIEGRLLFAFDHDFME